MAARRFVRSKVPQAASAVISTFRPAAMFTVIAPHAEAGKQVAINPSGTVVGRGATCDLVLASELVSREHAVVRVHDGEYVVEDLGSTNGTWLGSQRLTGRRGLRDGDLLTFADVAVEFQLSGTRQIPPGPSQPPPGDPWHPEDPTKPLRAVPSLRSELHHAPGFSTGALLLAILGSVVGTVLSTAAGTGRWGSLAGAAIGPVVSTVFSRKLAGEKGRIRTAAVVILSASALVITVAGISLTEKAVGKPVIPGASEGGTFVPDNEKDRTPPSETAPKGKPGIKVASLDCGSVPVGTTSSCATAIKSVGTGGLRITSIEMIDGDSAEFDTSEDCVGDWIAAGDSCELTVSFTPSAADQRTATIVIHQNLPSPDHGTKVQLTGTGAAVPASGEATLSVVVDSSAATGTVVSDSGDIACPDACSATFDSGASVVLSATYDQGTGSVEWDGCDSSDSQSCTVQLGEDRTVSARLLP